MLGECWVLFLGLTVPVTTATADVRHVSKSGIDNPTCAQTAPCATVHHAVTIANAGDIVRIAKGTYKESTGIVIGKNLTVEGAGSFTTYVPKQLER